MRCRKLFTSAGGSSLLIGKRQISRRTILEDSRAILQPSRLRSQNTGHKMATLESLHFDNKALRSLPLDKETENFVRQVPGACFSLVKPTPVQNPETVAFSGSAMHLLDLHSSELCRPEFAEYFSGNRLLAGSRPAAHCYCGHQFGYFSGQLGDGAAL